MGAGKTTLARLLGEHLGVTVVLEDIDRHPFLADFYSSPSESALQTEICFVLLHYHQLCSALRSAAGGLVVTDFSLDKDSVFASVTLRGEEMPPFRGVFEYFAAKLPAPDLVVYLDASVDLQYERVFRRGRPFEAAVSRGYLERLSLAYYDYLHTLPPGRTVCVNADETDFLRQADQCRRLGERIARALELA